MSAFVAMSVLFLISLCTFDVAFGSPGVPVKGQARGGAVPVVFVANSGSGTVSVISAGNDTVVATIRVGGDPWSVAVSPNGAVAYVVNVASNSVSVVDTASDRVTRTIPVGKAPTAVSFAPGGALAYVTDSVSDTVSVIDTRTDRVVHTIAGVKVQPYALSPSPDGKTLYVADVDHFSNAASTLSVINTSTDKVTATLPGFDGAEGVATSPDGSTAYVANVSSNSVSVVSLEPKVTIVASVSVGVGPQGVATNADGSTLYVANGGARGLGTVSVIDTATRTVAHSVEVGSGPSVLALSADGNRAYVTNYASDSVSVIDTATETVVATVPVGKTPKGIAVAVVPNDLRSTITSSLALPQDAFASLGHTVVNLAVAGASILFVAFPAQLFNSTFKENYDDIALWWTSRFRRLRRRLNQSRKEGGSLSTEGEVDKRWRPRAELGLVIVLGALFGSLLDPHFGWNKVSATSYVAIVLSIILGLVVPGIALYEYRKRRQKQTSFTIVALPAGLLVAVVCLVVSRAVAFQPGYLYGVIFGIAFAGTLEKQEEGHTAALTTIASSAVAVIAWILFIPVDHAAAHPSSSWALVLLADFLAAVFTGGIVGATIGSLPLSFLPGGVLAAWHKWAWAAVFGTVVFVFVEVLLNPARGGHPGHGPLVTIMVLLIVFGGGSVIFHEHFSRKKKRAQAASDHAT